MQKELEALELEITCPFCGKKIHDLLLAKLNSVIGVRYAYFCSDCNQLIKLSKDKDEIFTSDKNIELNKHTDDISSDSI